MFNEDKSPVGSVNLTLRKDCEVESYTEREVRFPNETSGGKTLYLYDGSDTTVFPLLTGGVQIQLDQRHSLDGKHRSPSCAQNIDHETRTQELRDDRCSKYQTYDPSMHQDLPPPHWKKYCTPIGITWFPFHFWSRLRRVKTSYITRYKVYIRTLQINSHPFRREKPV